MIHNIRDSIQVDEGFVRCQIEQFKDILLKYELKALYLKTISFGSVRARDTPPCQLCRSCREPSAQMDPESMPCTRAHKVESKFIIDYNSQLFYHTKI